ncbi:hypothetical protein Slin14017_G075910 [Septoria linicola]|nr:hypothetical protein Slin14017_G075910 [Septoria linicola]
MCDDCRGAVVRVLGERDEEEGEGRGVEKGEGKGKRKVEVEWSNGTLGW